MKAIRRTWLIFSGLSIACAIQAAPVLPNAWTLDQQALASIMSCNSQDTWRRFVESPNAGVAEALAKGRIRRARFFGGNDIGQFEFTRPAMALGLKVKGFSVSFGAIPGPAVFVEEPVELVRQALASRGIALTCGPQANPGSEGCESGEIQVIDIQAPVQIKTLSLLIMRDRAKIPSGETAVICVGLDKPEP